jgi:hypothetical protein
VRDTNNNWVLCKGLINVVVWKITVIIYLFRNIPLQFAVHLSGVIFYVWLVPGSICRHLYNAIFLYGLLYSSSPPHLLVDPTCHPFPLLTNPPSSSPSCAISCRHDNPCCICCASAAPVSPPVTKVARHPPRPRFHELAGPHTHTSTSSSRRARATHQLHNCAHT